MKAFKYLYLISLIALVGCQSVPYDYSLLSERKPRSILVIPPMNDSVEVAAPYTFLSTISKPLAEKGYYVFPVAVIDSFMKENGLPTPAEMNSVPLDKLHEQFNADAVLYVHIEEWGQKYQVISSSTVVNAYMKLIDAQTGELLWDARSKAVESSDDGGGGLVGALVGALVTQITGSIVDRTPSVATLANNTAIYNTNRGLLNGPYVQAKEKEATK